MFSFLQPLRRNLIMYSDFCAADRHGKENGFRNFRYKIQTSAQLFMHVTLMHIRITSTLSAYVAPLVFYKYFGEKTELYASIYSILISPISKVPFESSAPWGFTLAWNTPSNILTYRMRKMTNVCIVFCFVSYCII